MRTNCLALERRACLAAVRRKDDDHQPGVELVGRLQPSEGGFVTFALFVLRSPSVFRRLTARHLRLLVLLDHHRRPTSARSLQLTRSPDTRSFDCGVPDTASPHSCRLASMREHHNATGGKIRANCYVADSPQGESATGRSRTTLPSCHPCVRHGPREAPARLTVTFGPLFVNIGDVASHTQVADCTMQSETLLSRSLRARVLRTSTADHRTYLRWSSAVPRKSDPAYRKTAFLFKPARSDMSDRTSLPARVGRPAATSLTDDPR